MTAVECWTHTCHRCRHQSWVSSIHFSVTLVQTIQALHLATLLPFRKMCHWKRFYQRISREWWPCHFHQPNWCSSPTRGTVSNHSIWICSLRSCCCSWRSKNRSDCLAWFSLHRRSLDRAWFVVAKVVVSQSKISILEFELPCDLLYASEVILCSLQCPVLLTFWPFLLLIRTGISSSSCHWRLQRCFLLFVLDHYSC